MRLKEIRKEEDWKKVAADCAKYCNVPVTDVIAVGTWLFNYVDEHKPAKLPRKTTLKELRARLSS